MHFRHNQIVNTMNKQSSRLARSKSRGIETNDGSMSERQGGSALQKSLIAQGYLKNLSSQPKGVSRNSVPFKDSLYARYSNEAFSINCSSKVGLVDSKSKIKQKKKPFKKDFQPVINRKNAAVFKTLNENEYFQRVLPQSESIKKEENTKIAQVD